MNIEISTGGGRPARVVPPKPFNTGKLEAIRQRAHELQLAARDLSETAREIGDRLRKERDQLARLEAGNHRPPVGLVAGIGHLEEQLLRTRDQLAERQAELGPARELADSLTEYAKTHLGWSPDRPRFAGINED